MFNWRDRRHPDAGGAELVCEEIAARFAERGERVVLLTASSPGNARREERDGYTIVRRGGRFSVYPMALAWLLAHRREIGAVIDSQNGIPSFAPLVVPRATPVVLLIHHVHQDQFGDYFPRLAARVARVLESTVTRWVYRDRVVASVSPSTRRDVRIRLGLKGTSYVVPPGAPSPRPLGPISSRSPEPLIVCVGRLVPQKRTELIVEAMMAVRSELPTARLVVVGDGPHRHAIEAEVARLGLGDCVSLVGALAAPERDALVGQAWLTVSASRREGWGLTILEANAAGVPAVAFRVPGLKDAIRHGETGWLVDPDGPLAPSIVEALRELRDHDVARAVRQQAQAWVGNFSWDAMTDRFAAILRDESQRLTQAKDNRRLRTDLGCVAEIPRRLLPSDWAGDMRLGDQAVVTAEQVTFLFHGADTQSVHRALVRIGVPSDRLADPEVRVRLARPRDLVALSASAPVGGITGAAAPPADDPLAEPVL
ncbi:MAG: glycosyltransferase family 4 protein [Acidobacteriota bacterium]|nr:glycosyltransferase family 4 protein [Acidobacteriota bacterium]